MTPKNIGGFDTQ